MSQGIPMPIQKVPVENFKSFSELDIRLSKFNVVIGSNAAGKSNFISIFRFLHDIASSGVVNAIAMQGGSDYLRNAKIGTSRDPVIRIGYTPDSPMDVVENKKAGPPFLGMRACESTYEFILRFTGRQDDFIIVKDRLVIGCEVSACSRDGTEISKGEQIGRGQIEVTSVDGEIRYSVAIPPGCPLTENEVIPVFFRNKRLPEKTLLL